MNKRIIAALALATGLAACGGPGDAGADDAATQPGAFTQCRACHSLEPGQHGLGPSLAGVYGREAAKASGFAYSAAMRDSGVVWDDATLDAYLANPRATMPGTSMSYPGLRDDAARAELVEWLKGV